MEQNEIKKAIGIFYPALALDSVIRRESRETASEVLGFVTFIFLLLVTIAQASKRFVISLPPDILSIIKYIQKWESNIAGLFMISLSLWTMFVLLKAFYNSYYFRGLQTSLKESGLPGIRPLVTFESATVLYEAIRSDDLTRGFVRSTVGRRALVRAGVSRDLLNNFFASRLGHASISLLVLPKRDDSKFVPVGLSEIVLAMCSIDQEFARALSVQDISPKDLAGASDWVERMEEYFRGQDRFWGKDSLGRIQGIGKSWGYGGAYALEMYAHDITNQLISARSANSRKEEQDELEAVLSRSGEANALLIADEGAGALDIVFGLAFRISQGSVLPPLEHKRVFFFDDNAFIASVKTKAKFESEFLHILNQSVHAGNIILIIDDLPNFIESAKGLGSDVISLMDSYLASPNFQVIAIANPGAFHQGLEGDSKVLHRFEKIAVKELGVEETIKTLEDHALIAENKNKLFFTYQSLAMIADGARRYLGDGVLSDRALHLFDEIIPSVISKKKDYVEKSDVLDLIETKTGIKTGEVSLAERGELLHLEDTLHQRIIGQDEAIRVISNAMRRSRSDIANPDRPMGSFLFLGPTGVGKTETTKALAANFFGNEDSIIRLDMSEYQTDDAITRLIGSFEDGKPGVLSTKLREKSYGVLLLDEFEKTSKDVLNLFLQILDEGFFSDMAGKRVNARNLIIIATSNAGSDLIWQMLGGTNAEGILDKEVIINEIINRGIFKPELLNRFDGVILFHPLTTENLQKIAGLMLKKLQKRLTEKGIELVINDALMQSVMKAGTDPQFGARPMNRAIQEKVEQVIAQKIIAGVAKPGSRLELTEEELA